MLLVNIEFRRWLHAFYKHQYHNHTLVSQRNFLFDPQCRSKSLIYRVNVSETDRQENKNQLNEQKRAQGRKLIRSMKANANVDTALLHFHREKKNHFSRDKTIPWKELIKCHADWFTDHGVPEQLLQYPFIHTAFSKRYHELTRTRS